jgi:hypothetical protein
MEFYRTVGGRRFIDHTIPDLILQLQKVAVGLDRLSEILEGARRGAAPAADAPTEPGGARG